MDPVTKATYSAFCHIRIFNIIHQIMAYAASIHNDRHSLQSTFWYFFYNIFSSPIYDPAIIWVRQSCKPAGNSKLFPITQLVYPSEIDIPHIKFFSFRLFADSLSLPLRPSGSDKFQSQLRYKPDIQFNCKPSPSQREVNNLIVSLPFRRCLSFSI